MQVPQPPNDDFVYWNGVANIHGDRLALLRKIGELTRGNPNGLQRRALLDEYQAAKDPAYKAAYEEYERTNDPVEKEKLCEKVNAAFEAAKQAWRDQASQEQFADMYEAAGQLAQLVRDVFRMAPYDEMTGGGASEALCWQVWYSFRDSCHEDKKKRATLPTGSTPTESPATSSQLTPSISA